MAIYRHEPSHNRRDENGVCDGAKPQKNKDETQLPSQPSRCPPIHHARAHARTRMKRPCRQ